MCKHIFIKLKNRLGILSIVDKACTILSLFFIMDRQMHIQLCYFSSSWIDKCIIPLEFDHLLSYSISFLEIGFELFHFFPFPSHHWTLTYINIWFYSNARHCYIILSVGNLLTLKYIFFFLFFIIYFSYGLYIIKRQSSSISYQTSPDRIFLYIFFNKTCQRFITCTMCGNIRDYM